MTQMEACGWEAAPDYVVRDRDCAYGEAYVRRLHAMGIRDRPTSPRLLGRAGPLLDGLGGPPPPATCSSARPAALLSRFSVLHYRAQSWKMPRRVVTKVEWHPRELYPRVGFVVTNQSCPAQRAVVFCNRCGTAAWCQRFSGASKPFLQSHGYHRLLDRICRDIRELTGVVKGQYSIESIV
jgi:hypothetical protein